MKDVVDVNFNLEEAADYLRIRTKKLHYYAVRKKLINYINFGCGDYLFQKSDLDAFINSMKKPSSREKGNATK